VVTMKNAVVWDVTPCGSCKDRLFGGTISPIIRVARISDSIVFFSQRDSVASLLTFFLAREFL
jgi:hypothetical protein